MEANKIKQALEAQKTIVRAREILNTKGWVKHTFKSQHGAVCLLQAINEANGPGEKEAERIIIGCIGTTIPTWNDKQERVKEDIYTVLDAAENIAKELADETQ